MNFSRFSPFIPVRGRCFVRELPMIAALIAMAMSVVHGAEVFPRGTAWKWFKGRSAPSPLNPESWQQRLFDDQTWAVGPAPFFYGETVSGGTELADMRGNYSSVYFRKTFEVSRPGDVRDIDFGIAVDDGFILWINGVQVTRYNVPDGALGFGGTAVGAVAEPVPFESFRIENLNHLLVQGANVAAVQVFNVSLSGSSDFYFDASLSLDFDSTPPSVELIVPPPGSTVRELDYIGVDFNERVLGVEAADLLINGKPASSVSESAPGQFIFSFPQPVDGIVKVAWRPDHQITDRAGDPHPFAGGSWEYQLTSKGPAPGINISEFMADNDRTLNDEDGDSSDWIEIENPGENAAELTGWFLTDDASNLTKWKFPAISVQPKGYLLVFASEKNRTDPASKLHTNFKLSPSGEYLALVSPETNVVSSFAPRYPAQTRDVSYGRVPGTGTEGYFSRPTPGGANPTGGPGFSPEPVFSSFSGNFVEPFDLKLTSSNTNAVIRYTLNGSSPTNDSPVYLGPIRISATTQVRARTYVPGLLPGPVRSEGFVQMTNTLVNFFSDLPVLVIHAMGQGTVTPSRQTPVQLSVYEPVNGITSLTNRPVLSTRGAVKVRGSSTESYPKVSLALECWDELNLDKDVSLLGLPANADWVLYAPNNFDPGLIHNPFMHTLSKAIGRYSPRTRFVEVYLNSGNVGTLSEARYNGIYVLEEKIKIGKDRVDIDKLEPENLKEPEVTGGYLMKVDRLDPGDTGFSGAGVAMAYVDPKEREIKLPTRIPQRNYLSNYFKVFGLALNDAKNWLDPVLGYRKFIDTSAWVDFHLLNTLSANPDGFSLSTYLHKPRNGPITYGPIWDFDRTLGSTDGRDTNPRTWGGGGSSHFFSFGWWGRVFKDPDFFQAYIDRYQELRKGEFATVALLARVDRLGNEVRQAQPRERARWRVAPRGGSYQAELNLMKNWLSNRVEYIDLQFVKPPVANREGGTVAPGFQLTLAAAGQASILYTLDGRDPRLPNGQPSASALVYSGPVRLDANARLFARARDLTHRPRTNGDAPPLSSPWSGPVTATFTVTPFPLQISEVMFHPEDTPAGSIYSGDDFQFLELRNSGTAPVRLAGLKFTSPFQFTFPENAGSLPAGARTVLVHNSVAFRARYPGATNVSGEFSTPLPHGRGRVTLVGPLLEPVVDFTYNDYWLPLADGFGFSMVAIDESNPALHDPGSASAWRLSGKVGGSPGVADVAGVRPLPVLVNEVLANPGAFQEDMVELYNPGTAPVDVSNWWLTDDFRTPRKFRIPAGTALAAGGYLTFRESQWKQSAGSKFALSSGGDSIYLFSADASGTLTGWFHGFQYGASPQGASFGRHVTSAGIESLVIQSRPTPGLANAGPLIGPLVISEIMFHPPAVGSINNTLDEYIELHNTSSEPVLLFDPSNPEATWRLRGDISFDFPPSSLVSPTGFLVVVSFDPIAQPGRLAAFKSRYGLGRDTAVMGPWNGQLNNGGGSVRLLSPGLGGNPNSDSHVSVDEIDFSPNAPWPSTATGTGQSLVRRDHKAFGNDPQNWMAALPSPGDLDSDLDGLPDSWERQNGLNPSNAAGGDGALGDPDQDGVTNMDELRAGTLPRDPASLLMIQTATVSQTQVFLSFRAQPGRSYTLMYQDGLGTNAPWQVLRSFVAPLSSDSMVISDARTNNARFYRLQSP